MKETFCQPIAATLATAGTWLADANAVLTLLVTLLTLAWWLRLWWKKPDQRPPWLKDDNDHRNPPGCAACGLLVLVLLLAPGCASMKTTIFESENPDGTWNKETVSKIRTFWEAKSELAKLHTTATDKTQSISVSGLSQSASTTNLLPIVESVARGVAAGLNPAK